MAFKEDWKNNWEREWDVTKSSTGWEMTDADFLTFEGVWDARDHLIEVKIQRIKDGKATDWLEKCTYVDSGGGKVRGTIRTVPFTITRTAATSEAKAKLECRPDTPLDITASSRRGGFIDHFVEAVILRPAAALLTRLARRLDPNPSGGRPGSWTAEDGGTNFHLTVSPFEARPRGGARRRA